MNRLANASSRSTRLYDLRTKQDDDRCDIDPRKEPRRERERPVRREQGERSGEVAERQLGDLPQHGRYQCALRGGPPRWPVTGNDAIHDIEKDEADREAREGREDLEGDRDNPTEPRRHERIGGRRGAEREAEGHECEDRERGDEPSRLEVAANEAPSALPAENQRERAIERTVNRHRREDRADHTDRKRERASLHELVRDTGFLGSRRGVDVAQDFDEVAFGALRPVDEGENADEQREERDEREEDLVRDRTGEEGAIVLREALDERSAARNSAG